MSIIAKQPENTGVDPLEPGTYPARCVEIVDLGFHLTDYEDKAGNKKTAHKVAIRFELPTEMFDAEKNEPRFVSSWYTNSLAPQANLRQDLENWRAKEFTQEELDGFDLCNLLGVPCQLTIKIDDNKKNRIAGISKAMKGLEIPAQITPSRFFSTSEPTVSQFEALPEFMQNKIKEATNWGQINAAMQRNEIAEPPTDEQLMEEKLPF